MSDRAAVGANTVATRWWERPGLEIRHGRLTIAGRDAEELAHRLGTPRYVFDLARIREQVEALDGALARAGLTHLVRFAMKACREPEVLHYLRGLADLGSRAGVGIDACSPGEVYLARDLGWQPEQISLTGTNLTDADLRGALAQPVHINVDLLSQLRRVGTLFPGRRIGLRVNPKVSAVRGGGELYSGASPTKFGIYPEDLGRALDIAQAHDLKFVTLHFHIGWSYRDAELPAFERAVEEAAGMIPMLQDGGHSIQEVNVGGGLGLPLQQGDEPLDLDRWAEILARHLGPKEVVVGVEPGEFLVKEAGVLLAQVVTVESRLGATFAGLDVGWNAMQQRFVYGEPVVFALSRAPGAGPLSRVTFSGNINEGDDLFATDYPFPPIAEGDIIAMLGVGAYNQGMASEHCLRPRAGAVYFDQRI